MDIQSLDKKSLLAISFLHLEDTIMEKNKSLNEENIKNNHSKVFAYLILADIKYIKDNIDKRELPIRYMFFVTRNLCEQIIEYLYCMNNEAYLNEYYNTEIPTISIDNLASSVNFIKNIIGQKRFNGNRERISKMCEELGELEGTLYQTFSLLSEACHNSYYWEYVTRCGDAQNINVNIELKNLLYVVVSRLVNIIDKEYEKL